MKSSELPSYYAIIPATVRYDNRLKSAEKLLYSEITALANKNGYCFAQNKYFAELYNVTVVTVSRWISHLQKLKYIETEIIRNEKQEIISRNIYIVDIPYYQKNQYPYKQKSKEGINKNVKDNIINNNIDDDIFYYIINNKSKVPKKFLDIIKKLEFNYEPYMLKYMREDKINMIKNIILVLYELYKNGFYSVLHKVERENLINLYLLAVEKNPNNLLNYYKKSIINDVKANKKYS